MVGIANFFYVRGFYCLIRASFIVAEKYFCCPWRVSVEVVGVGGGYEGRRRGSLYVV